VILNYFLLTRGLLMENVVKSEVFLRTILGDTQCVNHYYQSQY
jgi:hypothetical protein